MKLNLCVCTGLPMHDALTLGLTIGSPLFAVMFGVLLNQRALDKLEDRMNARLVRLESRMDRLEARIDSMKEDQARFFETLASHDAKIGILMDERRKP